MIVLPIVLSKDKADPTEAPTEHPTDTPKPTSGPVPTTIPADFNPYIIDEATIKNDGISVSGVLDFTYKPK